MSVLTSLKRRELLYALVLVAASTLLFVRTFLYARLFTIELFGLLNQALLIASTFTMLAGLGLFHLAQKHLPQLHARGEREKFDDLLSSCVTVCGVSAFVAGLILGIALAFGWLHRDLAFVVVLPYAVAQSLFLVRVNEIKSELRFLDYAWLSAARAVAFLTVGVGVAAFTNSVAATLAAETLVTFVITAPLVIGERGKQVWRQLRALRSDRSWLAIYYPAALRLLMLNGAIAAVYLVDRWTGVVLLTKHQYGIFALGLTTIMLFDTAQAIVNVAAYPLMGRMVAQGKHRRAFRFATCMSGTLIAAGVACYIPFVLMLDTLLRDYLPAYIESGNVIRLAVIAGILRLSDFYTVYAILLDFEKHLTIAYGALFAVAVVGIAVTSTSGLVSFDPGRMMGVTVCVASSVFLTNLVVATHAYRKVAVRPQ